MEAPGKRRGEAGGGGGGESSSSLLRPLSREECRGVLDAVKAAAFRLRGSAKRAWERLGCDLLLVLDGMRPAAMVDYAVVSAADMATILRDVREALPPEAAADLHLLEIEGCVYPCRLDALALACAERLPAPQTSADAASATAFVMLGEGVPPRLVSDSEATALAAGLRPILSALEEARNFACAAAEESEGARGGRGRRGGEGGGRVPRAPRGVTLYPGNIISVDLQEATGVPFCSGIPSEPIGASEGSEKSLQPLLPTINGWLLGYPVVYAVTPSNAASAALVLSRCTLRVFSVKLPCSLLVASAASSSNPMCASDRDVLFSFTVPDGLDGGIGGSIAEAAAVSMRSSLRRGFNSPEEVWGKLEITATTRAPGPVAL